MFANYRWRCYLISHLGANAHGGGQIEEERPEDKPEGGK